MPLGDGGFKSFVTSSSGLGGLRLGLLLITSLLLWSSLSSGTGPGGGLCALVSASPSSSSEDEVEEDEEDEEVLASLPSASTSCTVADPSSSSSSSSSELNSYSEELSPEESELLLEEDELSASVDVKQRKDELQATDKKKTKNKKQPAVGVWYLKYRHQTNLRKRSHWMSLPRLHHHPPHRHSPKR